ncbi:MAG: trehalase family glycosidase [Planctomycetota bacterium]
MTPGHDPLPLILTLVAAALLSGCRAADTRREPVPWPGGWNAVRDEASTLGKPAWRDMLVYTADLHRRATRSPADPFDHPWEEIGPGYLYGPAFGHWDLIHQLFDTLPTYPRHALDQLYNNLKLQQDNGFVPGAIWMPGGPTQREEVWWMDETQGHPPVWIVAADEYVRLTGDDSVLPFFYAALVRQLGWFEQNRACADGGFYYADVTHRQWESGIDESVRFDDLPPGLVASPRACVDATSHVYWAYRHAAKWAAVLGEPSNEHEARAEQLGAFIRDKLYVSDDGMFYDAWAVDDPSLRRRTFDTMWPVVVGAASPAQAQRYIDEVLLDNVSFFTTHPMPATAVDAAEYEPRMWRGGAWNSMTHWAARGCVDRGRPDAAAALLERALDQSARHFDRTGTIWEFYDPRGGPPEAMKRKGGPSELDRPCRDYLGHNPLLAMARLYDELSAARR